MKILIISHMYPSTFDKVKGIFVQKQVQELKRQGHKIKVVSPVPWAPFPLKFLSEKWEKYSQIPQKQMRNRIEIYYPRYLTFPKGLFCASSGKRLYQGIKQTIDKIYNDFKFDIIHSHTALPDGYAGMKLSQNYKKPLIITIHGKDLQQTIYKNKKCKKIIKKIINFSKKTIVVSNKLKKGGVRTLNIQPKKLTIVPNGINAKDIYKGESDLYKNYKGKTIILSISHLISTKGIDYNLRAIAKLKKQHPNILYLIIGRGSKKGNLKKIAEKLDLKNNVQFLDQLSHKKVMEYVSICDIFSLPSWNESFGIVYIEAMAHAKPTIACEREGIDGIIKHKETGLLVKPKNSDSIASSIDFLFSHPERARKIGKNAKNLVLNNYTWEKNARKNISIYKQAIKNYEK